MAHRIQGKFLKMADEALHNLALKSFFSGFLISYSLFTSQPYPCDPSGHSFTHASTSQDH